MTVRSFLYVPATRAERYAKAVDSGAHAVIVDLEDAVAPADKATARETLKANAAAMRARCDAAGCRFVVRINARATEWYDADVALCKTLPLHAIVIPKPDDAYAIAALMAHLPGLDYYLLVETLSGFDNLKAIARVPGVTQLMLGAADLMLDSGITDEGEPLHFFRSLVVMHSKLAGLPPPVDGVCMGLEDDAMMAREITRAKGFGFGAKLCVHPRQVAPIHAGFLPSAAEIAWARRVCEMAGSADGAAVRVDGRLVDAPILRQARRIVELADA